MPVKRWMQTPTRAGRTIGSSDFAGSRSVRPACKKSEARLFVRRASLAERITTFLALSVERLEVLSFRETVASKLIDPPSQTFPVICADIINIPVTCYESGNGGVDLTP